MICHTSLLHFAVKCVYLVLVSLVFRSHVFFYVPYEVDITFDPDTATPGYSCLRTAVRCVTWVHGRTWPTHRSASIRLVIALGREGTVLGTPLLGGPGGREGRLVHRCGPGLRQQKRPDFGEHASWLLGSSHEKGPEYRVSSSPPLLLSIEPKLKRVGVYVDYEEGQVSFYDVQNKRHIYTFMDSFKEKLFPFFYLYCCDKASDAMMLFPVQETSHTKQC